MERRLSRPLACCFVALLLAVGSLPARASQIMLKSGEVYLNATILHRDANSLEVRVRYGTLTLPLALVDRIDGVPVSVPPPPPPVAPTFTPTPKPALPSMPRPVLPPVASPSPAASHAAVPAAARPSPSPPIARPWWAATQDAWQRASLSRYLPTGRVLLLGLVVLGLWVLTLPRLRRELRASPGGGWRGWFLVAFLLPGIGYVLYRLNRYLASRPRAPSESVRRSANRLEFLDADHNPIAIDESSSVFSGLENARNVIEAALAKRASDVHIEPAAQEYRVRLRVDGAMLPDRTFPTADGLRLVSAFKTLAQLDIAERRKAQDGRFGAREDTRAVDFRAATVPSVHGEKLVLRILDRQAGMRGLNDLGMPQAMLERFAEIVHSRSGMILATGPTGSGKTSTLYAALGQLDATQLSLVTIEDPVEYELAGATQIPVNLRAGVTYETGLKSILRQDPDVILVGEMRDLDSVQIALRAALTGHLVFSSLHTRDAVGAVMRLEEMGIEPHLIASALFVVLSQRLVRTLCEHCRQSYAATGDELSSLGIEFNPGDTLYRAVGCRRCEGTGYKGRTGIFEMLVFDEEIRQPVNDGIEEDALLRLARERGFASYREDGAMKILLGITTVDEVLKSN